MDQYAEPIVKKCIAKALEGEMRAVALCIERILPPLREPGVHLKLPKLDQLQDVDLAVKLVLQSIAGGNMTPDEGEKIATILQNYRETIERSRWSQESKLSKDWRRTRKGGVKMKDAIRKDLLMRLTRLENQRPEKGWPRGLLRTPQAPIPTARRDSGVREARERD